MNGRIDKIAESWIFSYFVKLLFLLCNTSVLLVMCLTYQQHLPLSVSQSLVRLVKFLKAPFVPSCKSVDVSNFTVKFIVTCKSLNNDVSNTENPSFLVSLSLKKQSPRGFL